MMLLLTYLIHGWWLFSGCPHAKYINLLKFSMVAHILKTSVPTVTYAYDNSITALVWN